MSIIIAFVIHALIVVIGIVITGFVVSAAITRATGKVSKAVEERARKRAKSDKNASL